MLFNDSENRLKSSLRTWLEKKLKNISKSNVILKSLVFFQIARKLKNISKTNVIYFFCSRKNSPREIPFFFVARLRRYWWSGRRLSHVCGGFNEKTSHLILHTFINHEVRVIVFGTAHFFALKKKVLVAPAPLTVLTKHIIRLRRRCSCDFCRTSPAPLLVISDTLVKRS